MKRKRFYSSVIGLLLVLMIFIEGYTKNGTATSIMPDDGTSALNEDGSYAHVNENDSVLDIMNHSAFDGFGQFILPSDNGIYDKNMQLNSINSLLPYHNHGQRNEFSVN